MPWYNIMMSWGPSHFPNSGLPYHPFYPSHPLATCCYLLSASRPLSTVIMTQADAQARRDELAALKKEMDDLLAKLRKVRVTVFMRT